MKIQQHIILEQEAFLGGDDGSVGSLIDQMIEGSVQDGVVTSQFTVKFTEEEQELMKRNRKGKRKSHPV